MEISQSLDLAFQESRPRPIDHDEMFNAVSN